MNSTSFFGPVSKNSSSISLSLEEAAHTVTTTTETQTALHERIAVMETTAVMGKRALGLLVAAVVALFSLFYTNVIPDKVEQGISTSSTLSTRFGEVRDDVKKLDGRFEQLISTIRPLVSPKIVAAALRDAASSDQASLRTALTEIKNLLAVARDMKVPLRNKDYNEVSKPLFMQYLASKQPLKGEIWSTLVDLTNTKTRTDAILHPVSDREIEEARISKNYFEGDVDLSNKTVWQKAIFKNGKIKISKPDQDLTLSRVRFIDNEFQLAPENETSRSLLQSVLQNEGPQITATVARFKVLPPEAKIKTVSRVKPPLRNTPGEKIARGLQSTLVK